jgi:hypothetical protein
MPASFRHLVAIWSRKFRLRKTWRVSLRCHVDTGQPAFNPAESRRRRPIPSARRFDGIAESFAQAFLGGPVGVQLGTADLALSRPPKVLLRMTQKPNR